jgi:serine protease Do
VNAKLFSIAAIVATAHVSEGQQTLESAYRTTGTAVVAAFEPQRLVLQTSSAVILDGRRELVYGVVISPDGHILTKASEIHGVEKLSVRVNEEAYEDARILAVNNEWDVALIKIDATGLIPVVYAPTSAVPQGTWVVANGVTQRKVRRLMAGIVSANIREIPPQGGAALGVILSTKSKELEIDQFAENSGAKEAGLLKGDVILSVEGQNVKTLEELTATLDGRKAGTTIQLLFRRGGVEKTIDVRLTARGEMFDDQMSRNDQMSGKFSKRRSGFPRVMQHDILGAKSIVGGPLLDLQGRCLGMNIARANRAESFAIPVEDLKTLAESLMKQAAK